MYIIRYSLFSSILLFLCSCNLTDLRTKSQAKSLNDTKFKPTYYKDDYKIMVPSYLEQTSELHKQATIQYKNERKEFYTILIPDNKDSLLHNISLLPQMAFSFPNSRPLIESYFAFVKKRLKENKNFALFDTASTFIHNMKAVTASVTLTLENKTDIFYRIAVVEGKKNIYQLYTWTLPTYKETCQPIMTA